MLPKIYCNDMFHLIFTTDMQVVKNSHYRARKLGFWNRLIPDLVSSSGIIRDPMASESLPGATYPTITLVPTVSTTSQAITLVPNVSATYLTISLVPTVSTTYPTITLVPKVSATHPTITLVPTVSALVF